MTPDERQLNEKIARWVWPDAVLHWTDDDGLTRELNGPLYVGNITFTRSLDVQAQYVWPELNITHAGLILVPINGEWDCFVSAAGQSFTKGHAPTPALAAALAIKGLIESAHD